MIYGTYITHDFGVRYRLRGGRGEWSIETGLAENDFELYPGGVQWCDDEWHARARFERLVADDITKMQDVEK
jgi:hypothetical protein